MQRLKLLGLLPSERENGDDNGQRHSILELHGLGKEIRQGVDGDECVRKLPDDWEERR